MINEKYPEFRKLPNKKNPNFLYSYYQNEFAAPVSVITPFYEIGEIFLETVASIMNQSFQNFEWIIVDDGSKQEIPRQILKKVVASDPRIRMVKHEQNKGLPAARNTGIRNAKGRYIYFLDGDDLIEPTLLEKFYLFLSLNPQYDFVNSWSLGFQAQEYFWKKDFFSPREFLEENRVACAFMGRKELFEDLQYDEGMRGGFEDWEFWLKAFTLGKKGYTMPEFLFWYRRADHAARWTNWGDDEKRRTLTDSLRNRYASLKDMPGQNPDLNVGYALDRTSHNLLPPINVLPPRKKRILCLFPWLEIGGADKFNLDMMKRLAAEWDFTILTTLKGKNLWEPLFDEVTPDIFHLEHLSPFVSYHLVIDYLVATRKPELIFLSNSMLGYWTLPYIKQKYPHVRVVDYIHCEDPGWMNGGYPRMNALASAYIDRTLVTSHQLKSWINHISGAKRDDIEVCYINIDVETVRKDRANRERMRSEWGLPDDFPIILYAARITAQKQPLVMVEAVAKLARKTQNFLCIVLGEGPDFFQMKEKVRAAGLENKIWCMGSVSNEEVKRYMDVADIFFLPSLYEGIALSIYEAMAKSLAIVGADVGGQKELVTPECGYLIASSTPEREAQEYSGILHSLIMQPSLLASMQANSRDRVEKYFSIEDMGRQMDTAFHHALSAKARTAEPPAMADSYLTLLYHYLFEERVSHRLWNEIILSRDHSGDVARKLIQYNSQELEVELNWYKEEMMKINSWYHKEYEVLPLWYKRIGHIIKAIKGKRKLRSLFPGKKA